MGAPAQRRARCSATCRCGACTARADAVVTYGPARQRLRARARRAQRARRAAGGRQRLLERPRDHRPPQRAGWPEEARDAVPVRRPPRRARRDWGCCSRPGAQSGCRRHAAALVLVGAGSSRPSDPPAARRASRRARDRGSEPGWRLDPVAPRTARLLRRRRCSGGAVDRDAHVSRAVGPGRERGDEPRAGGDRQRRRRRRRRRAGARREQRPGRARRRRRRAGATRCGGWPPTPRCARAWATAGARDVRAYTHEAWAEGFSRRSRPSASPGGVGSVAVAHVSTRRLGHAESAPNVARWPIAPAVARWRCDRCLPSPARAPTSAKQIIAALHPRPVAERLQPERLQPGAERAERRTPKSTRLRAADPPSAARGGGAAGAGAAARHGRARTAASPPTPGRAAARSRTPSRPARHRSQVGGQVIQPGRRARRHRLGPQLPADAAAGDRSRSCSPALSLLGRRRTRAAASVSGARRCAAERRPAGAPALAAGERRAPARRARRRAASAGGRATAVVADAARRGGRSASSRSSPEAACNLETMTTTEIALTIGGGVVVAVVRSRCCARAAAGARTGSGRSGCCSRFAALTALSVVVVGAARRQLAGRRRGCSPTARVRRGRSRSCAWRPSAGRRCSAGIDARGGGRLRLRAADEGLPGRACAARTRTRACRNRTATGTRSA